MRDEYDFSHASKNPYQKLRKIPVTLRVDSSIIDYFKTLAVEVGIPYQTLINGFLADCVAKKMRPQTSWAPYKQKGRG